MVRAQAFAFLTLLVFFIVEWPAFAGDAAVLARDCKAWNLPAEIAGKKRETIEELASGTEVERVGKSVKGFSKVIWIGGRGYVLDSCLTKKEKARDTASLLYSGYSGSHFQMGIVGGLDFNLARGSITSDLGTQFGYGIGMGGMIPLTPQFRLSLASLYRNVSLTRRAIFTGFVSDSTTIDYTQSIAYIAIQPLVQYNLVMTTGISTPLELWLDAGGEFLYPLSGTQTDSLGTTTSFSPPDKPLLGILGLSAFYALNGGMGLNAALHGFFNTVATSNNTFFGARFQMALTLAL